MSVNQETIMTPSCAYLYFLLPKFHVLDNLQTSGLVRLGVTPVRSFQDILILWTARPHQHRQYV